MAATTGLRARREAQNLTQEQLAVKAGVSVATLRRAETGRGRPHHGTILLLATALDIAVTDLTAELADDELEAKAS